MKSELNRDAVEVIDRPDAAAGDATRTPAVQEMSGRIPQMDARPVEEHTIAVWDGTELFYRFWPADQPSDKSLLLFHRGHEHSGRMGDLVERLDLRDVNIIAWDARGHGRSPGDRGYAPSFGAMVRDVDSFVHAVSQRHGLPIHDMAVLAHSVGAVAVTAWVHDYHPPIRAMVLATPALRVKLYVPLAIPGLRFMSLIKPRFNVSSYVKGKMLTHDPDMAATYDADTLVSRNIAVNILLGLHDTATRLLDDADAIVTPTLVLSAENDWVVRNDAQRTFFDRLSSSVKRHITYPGMYHAILHETERDKPIADARAFLRERLDADATRDADTPPAVRERTQRKHDRLSHPAPLWQRPWWWVQRVGLATVCRLSKGIRIGASDGFDSGRSLDHVYRNTAEGVGPLGRLIDRIYLNAAGWRGIRQRKRNMHAVLTETIARVGAQRDAVRVLDIAAGPGRYLLDVLAECPSGNVTATLRDRDEAGLAAGRALAERMNLTDRARYETGDAFDEAALAATTDKVDIAIVSGLYELFADDAMIARSLRGLHGAVRDDGYLIYTNQPWHPQLDMIARTLRNRDGVPWVMRCRSQAEMDQLVAAAGFEKIATQTDDDGVFTVSLARRISR